MSRLLDDLRRADGIAVPRWIPRSRLNDHRRHAMQLMPYLHDPSLPLLSIDNVSEYYYTSEQEHWDIRRDFPNLAPPYEVFWMEHKLPQRVHSKECGDTDFSGMVPGGRIGTLFMTTTPENVGIAPDGGSLPPGTKWVYVAESYFDWGKMIGSKFLEGPIGTWVLCIDEHGMPTERPWLQTLATDPADLDALRSYLNWLHPAMLAISFLHCKNVRVIDNELPEKLRRSIAKKKGTAPTAFKTLVIEPLKEVLRREGKSDALGMVKALHICRGHFRDYRQGRGLFGKYKQLVWSPATVRGTKHEGEPAPRREAEIKL